MKLSNFEFVYDVSNFVFSACASTPAPETSAERLRQTNTAAQTVAVPVSLDAGQTDVRGHTTVAEPGRDGLHGRGRETGARLGIAEWRRTGMMRRNPT